MKYEYLNVSMSASMDALVTFHNRSQKIWITWPVP